MCNLFQEKMNATIQFGVNLSVRRDKNKETIIVLGHDECIFRQYALTNKLWNGPEEHKSFTPKVSGQGIMISTFQSRAFGFGMDLSEQQLEEINFFRDGKKYADESAAIAKQGSAYKKKFTESPFIFEFEYGAKGESYWTYEYMVLQLEDCADCLRALYPHIKFVFMLDRSCGHKEKLWQSYEILILKRRRVILDHFLLL